MVVLELALALSVPMFAPADDSGWGGFRGDNGTGLAPSATLPASLTKESAKWRVEVPAGYSSPIVAGDVVVVTAVEGTSLFTIGLDRTDGAERWRNEVEFDGERAGIGSPAAPSPVTDGRRVYVVFPGVGVLAYGLDGEEVWRRPLAAVSIPHGLSASPVLHGDHVILQVDEDLKAYLVAFDRETGEQRWRTERPGFLHGYATPAIYAPPAGPAEVVVNGSFKVCGYSVEDGELLWWVNGASYCANALPVIAGDRCFVNAYALPTSEFGMPPMDKTFDELLEERDANEDGAVNKDEWDDENIQMAWFIIDLDDDDRLDASEWEIMQRTDRETGALFSIRLGGRGDVTETHVDWKYTDRRGLSDIPSPVLVGDGLYMIREGGILARFDVRTGELGKMGRVGSPDAYYASPVAAGGKIVCASISGQLTIVRAGEEWEVLSSETLEGEEVWSTPAITGRQLFVRTQTAVYAFEAPTDG